jgi:hypothetical protein
MTRAQLWEQLRVAHERVQLAAAEQEVLLVERTLTLMHAQVMLIGFICIFSGCY